MKYQISLLRIFNFILLKIPNVYEENCFIMNKKLKPGFYFSLKIIRVILSFNFGIWFFFFFFFFLIPPKLQLKFILFSHQVFLFIVLTN